MTPVTAFLNEVLTRRTGIPITLSLVYLELAKRINFSDGRGWYAGAFFYIRPMVDEMDIFVDPFHGGEVALYPRLQRPSFKQMFGDGARLNIQHLEPISARAFLVRIC